MDALENGLGMKWLGVALVRRQPAVLASITLGLSHDSR